ncbi:MAG: substrate-binding domain-containing protein [Cyanobacteriota bacterium]|nr:substrate-binding domain-containing protein [Cyanobacteriota bacterium]
MSIIKVKLLESGAEGFHVSLNSSDGKYDSIDGFLPPLPQELESSFRNWQSAYHQLDGVRKVVTRLSPKRIVRYSSSEERDTVKTSLNLWLDGGDSRWRSLRDEFISVLTQLKASGQELRLFVDAKNYNLQRLPWQEWDLLQSRFPEAEIAVRVRGKGEIKPFPKAAKMRILVVVGKSEGINTELDLEVIKKLEEKGVEVKCLKQPTREVLSDALRSEPGYHIFIYTGHSRSQEDGSLGWISLRDDDVLSLEELKNSLRNAINKGLQLAIFNSCDGTGLAAELARLSLPRIIVMREPVPDEVAVKFLEYFFDEFANNKSLFASVHNARERLEHFEKSYPGASWLPTLCIRESALSESLSWQTILAKLTSVSEPVSASASNNKKFGVLAAGLLVGVFGILGVVYGVVTANKEESKTEVAVNFYSPKEESKTEVAAESTPCPEEPAGNLENQESSQYLRCFAYVKGVPNRNLFHGGSTSWAPIRGKINPKIEGIFPDFNLIYKQRGTVPLGSGTGILMLLEGALSFAESSRPLTREEFNDAKSRGFKLKQEAVAIDAIALVVNPSLNVDGLTLEEVKDIYTGKITNWQEVGGPNLKITPYYRPMESGTTPFFQENVLASQQLGKNAVLVDNTTEGLQKVGQAEDIGGIYFASAPEVVPQCRVKPIAVGYSRDSLVKPYRGELVGPENCPQQRNEVNIEAIQSGEYQITRNLYAIVKQDGSIDEEAGEAYVNLLLTDEGQNCIQNLGFVPIRSPESDDNTLCTDIE